MYLILTKLQIVKHHSLKSVFQLSTHPIFTVTGLLLLLGRLLGLPSIFIGVGYLCSNYQLPQNHLDAPH